MGLSDIYQQKGMSMSSLYTKKWKEKLNQISQWTKSTAFAVSEKAKKIVSSVSDRLQGDPDAADEIDTDTSVQSFDPVFDTDNDDMLFFSGRCSRSGKEEAVADESSVEQDDSGGMSSEDGVVFYMAENHFSHEEKSKGSSPRSRASDLRGKTVGAVRKLRDNMSSTTIDNRSAGQSSTRQRSAGQSSTRQRPVGQSPARQRAAGQSPARQRPVGQPPARQRPAAHSAGDSRNGVVYNRGQSSPRPPSPRRPRNEFLGQVAAALAVDFDKPLTFREQLVIMFTILLISIILFGFVYLLAPKGTVLPANGTASEQSGQEEHIAPPDEVQTSVTSENSGQSEKEDGQSSKTEHKKPEVREGSLLKNFTVITLEHDDIYQGEQILVNKEYSCHLNGENTVSLIDRLTGSYAITDDRVSLNEDIVDDVNRMLDNFYEAVGESDIMIACGYRSYDTQQELFVEEVKVRGDAKEAEKWVLPPGFSEHQTGYAFDLNLNRNNDGSGIQFDGTGIYEWLHEHCWEYGFIVRYPIGRDHITGISYEPWHFRYVGLAPAAYIFECNMTLEEYIDIVHTHDAEKPLMITGEEHTWCAYYVEAGPGENDIYVPSDHSYTVSGDNVSGFIVTVLLDE